MNSELCASRLNKAIKESGLTNTEICSRTGINHITLQKFQTGMISTKSIEKLVEIADVLHVSMDYLCGRTAEDDNDYFDDRKAFLKSVFDEVVVIENEKMRSEFKNGKGQNDKNKEPMNYYYPGWINAAPLAV